MKKKIVDLLVLASFAVLGGTMAYAGLEPGTGVPLSKHDINTLTGAAKDSQGRICAFCHTPHHAIDPTAADYMPLWSHDLTTQVYIPYQSVTLEAETKGVVDPLSGPSRLCMSCHDGIIAADQHYGSTDNTKVLKGDTFASGSNMAVGTNGDLTNDHPIGFDYNKVAGASGASGTDKGIFPADDNLTYKGNNAAVKVKDQLWGGNIMTCATCHDVHNKDNTNGGATGNYFVYAPQKDSQLCLTCHDK